MTIVSYSPFTGSDGAAWPAPWTTIGGTRTIQSGRGQLSAASGYVSSTAHTTGVSVGDVRLTGTFRIGNLLEQYPAIGVRHNGAWNGGLVDDGIILYLDIAGNTVDLQLILNGVADSSIGTFASVTWAANTDYRFTIEVVEGSGVSHCRAKVWAETAYNLEPEDWMIEGTTSNSSRPTTGGVSIATVSGAASASTIAVDNLIVKNLNDGRRKLLAVGDSLTAGPYNFPGGTGNATWRRYVFDHYEGGANPLLMVGRNWSDGVADGSGVLGTYAGLGTWDHDHLARNSWTTSNIDPFVAEDVTNYQPDVAVIFAGVNDLSSATPAATATEIGNMITAMRASKGTLKFVLCQITPVPSDSANVATYNSALASLATSMTTSGSPIVVADLHTGFNTGWLYDGLHFTDDGDQFVADEIIAAIDAVFALEGGEGDWETLTTGVSTATTFVDTTAVNGTTYEYEVAAINLIGTGPYSVSDTATPATTAPGAPTSLVATAGGSGIVNLTWTAPASNGGSAITDYVVQYRTTAGPGSWNTFSDGTSTTASASVTGLTPSTSYDFQVAAVNAIGTGAYSATDTEAAGAGGGSAPVVLNQTAFGGRSALDSDSVTTSWSATAGSTVIIAIQTSSNNSPSAVPATPAGFTLRHTTTETFPDGRVFIYTRENVPAGTITYNTDLATIRAFTYFAGYIIEASDGTYQAAGGQNIASDSTPTAAASSAAAAADSLFVGIGLSFFPGEVIALTTPTQIDSNAGGGNFEPVAMGASTMTSGSTVTMTGTITSGSWNYSALVWVILNP